MKGAQGKRVRFTVLLALAAFACLAPAARAAAMEQVQAKAIPLALAPAPIPAPAQVAHPLRVANPAAYRSEKQAAQQRYRNFEASRAAVRGGGATGGRATTRGAAAPRTAVSVGLNQLGLNATGQGVTPPDTTGAIGPTAYVEMVNSEVAVYSAETLASPPLETSAESTFVGSGGGTCDGQFQWDQQGQRWLYAALDCAAAPGNQKLFFGWSRTPSPELSSTNWCRFALATGHSLEDYPKLGHDNSQILIGTNAFEDEGAESYTGSHIWVMNKPAVGVSSCPVSLTLGRANADFTPVPANVADSSARGYVVALRNFTHLELYEVGRNGGGENAILGERAVTVPEFAIPANVPQPGTADTIDSSDTRLTQAVAVTDPATGKEGIWTQHTVAGPGSGPSVVSWYELTPEESTPRQEGTVAGTEGTFAFNGAISPADDGEDAALAYNTGDATHLVDLRVQDRHGGAPLGAMGGEASLGASVAAAEDFSCGPVCRWGDYAGASPDPEAPESVWGTGELTTLLPEAEEAQWGSRNFSLDVEEPLSPLVSGAKATAVGERGATLTGSVNPGNRETTYSFEYGPTAAYGQATPVTALAANAGATPVSAALSGLEPGRTYHFRLVASNEVGPSASGDVTFTTAAEPGHPSEGGAPSSASSSLPPQAHPTAKPKLICRKGFRKKRVHGKLRCVKVHRR